MPERVNAGGKAAYMKKLERLSMRVMVTVGPNPRNSEASQLRPQILSNRPTLGTAWLARIGKTVNTCEYILLAYKKGIAK